MKRTLYGVQRWDELFENEQHLPQRLKPGVLACVTAGLKACSTLFALAAGLTACSTRLSPQERSSQQFTFAPARAEFLPSHQGGWHAAWHLRDQYDPATSGWPVILP